MATPKYIRTLLDDFQNIAKTQKAILGLLGPKLKAVTGNTDEINQLVDKVKKLAHNFRDYKADFYDKSVSWVACHKVFKDQSKGIEVELIELIANTFTKLRSSISGFDFLQKFKDMDEMVELEIIQKSLTGLYVNVLEFYKTELKYNKKIFYDGKDHTIVTKNKPPIAGGISWIRYIY